MSAERPPIEEQRATIRSLIGDWKLVVGEKAYILSAMWFRQWKSYVGYIDGLPSKDSCDSIDNNRLLKKGELSVGLMETIDFEIISRAVWKKLKSWYGGGPTIRVDVVYDPIKKHPIAELRKMKINLEYKGDITQYKFSKYRKVQEFKLLVCDENDINPEDYKLYDFWSKKKGKPLIDDQLFVENMVVDGSTLLLDSVSDPAYDANTVSTHHVNYNRPEQLCPSKSSPNVQEPKRYPPGTCGLANLTNTCYFNSGVQCIMHTMPLVNFLQSSNWTQDLSPNNPLGTKGILVKAFVRLLHEVWSGTTNALAPRELIRALHPHAPHFYGYNQQDSHELITIMLDLIHEDLNRVKNKQIVEPVTGDGNNDVEIADQSWHRHKLRNDSIIVDLFHGLLRSRLDCPKCNSTCVVFDPFVSLALPIPMPPSFTSKFDFIPFDFESPIVRTKLHLSNHSAKKFKEQLHQELNVNCEIIYAARMSEKNLTFFDGPHFVSGDEQFFLFEIPDSSKLYAACQFCTSMKGWFGRRYEEIFSHPFLIEVPSSDPTEEELYQCMLKRLSFLFDVAHQKCPFDMKKIKTHMMPLETKKKLEIKFVKPVKENDHIFVPNKKYKFFTVRTMNVVLNATYMHKKFCFNWHGLSRPIRKHKCKELKVTKPTLENCLESFTLSVALDDQNKWYCPKCKDFVCAEKKMDPWRFPKCLIIQFKRFQQSSYGISKIETEVNFPIEFDFGKYEMGNVEHKPIIYRLYGVVNHYGQMNGGHYTAFSYNTQTKRWYLFNDSSVKEIHESSIQSQAAYVLFYQRMSK